MNIYIYYHGAKNIIPDEVPNIVIFINIGLK